MKLRTLFYLTLLPLLVGSFTVTVNPFAEWNIPRITGFNDKITESNWDALIKSYQIQHQTVDTVILGSSRVSIALSPTHPAFSSNAVYNYGLSGAGIYFQYLSLQYALATQPIKKIIITPDFFGFNANLALNQPALHEHADLIQLMANPSGMAAIKNIPASLGNILANTLGWRGVNSSLRTLVAQNQKTVYIDAQGYWSRFGIKDRNFIAQYDRTERVYLSELLFPAPAKQYVFNDASSGYDSFEVYKQILVLAQQHQLQVDIIMLPTPTRDLLALQLLGQWQNYVHWKKTLVEINEAVASEMQTTPFPLWNFEIANTDIDTDNLADLKPYYFEPFHPTALTGDQVLNRVFMDCTLVKCWPGEQLDTRNVANSLARLDSDLSAFRAQNPKQLASLTENINKTSAYRNSDAESPAH